MGKIYHVTDIYKPIESGKLFSVDRPISIKRWLRENGLENATKERVLILHDLNNDDYILQSDWSKRKIIKRDRLALIEHPAGFDPITWGIIISVVLAAASIAIALTMPIPELGNENRQEAASVYNLNGHNNKLKLGQCIEVPYGRNRLWPTYAAKPYNKYVDNEQWLYSLFCLGQGEYDIEAIQIEDTPIGNFQDVNFQIYKPGETVTMFPDNVVTSSEVGNVELFASNESEYTGSVGGFVTNGSGTLTNYIEVDLVLPHGLYKINDQNVEDLATVSVLVEYRQIDDENIPIGGWNVFSNFTKTLKTQDAQRFTVGKTVTSGRYEVRARRTNAADKTAAAQDSIFWESLRAFLPSTKDYGDVTLLAVAARATNNLNSSSQNRINVIATRLLDVWNGVFWQENVKTRSAVWAYCDIFKSKYGANIDDSYLDLQSLFELDKYFDEVGYTFDWVFDNSSTIWEAAATISRSCGAVPMMNGSLISMTADRPLEIPTAVFSKENIIEGTFVSEYSMYDPSEYDSVEVEYIDGVTFQKETILCKVDDDIGEHPKTIQIHGVSNVEIAYRLGMRLRSQQRKLRKNYTFQTGLEGNIPNYGDLCYVSHDVPKFGIAGIVTGIDGNVIYTDKEVEFKSGKSYKVGLRKKDGSSLGIYTCYGSGKTNQIVAESSIDISELKLDGENNNAHWFFGATGNFAKVCKIVGIEPSEGEAVTVKVVEYDETVYAADGTPESGLPDGVFSGGNSGSGGSIISIVYDIPTVYGLSVIEVTGKLGVARASWTSTIGAQYFIVEKSVDGIYWGSVGVTTANQIEFQYSNGTNYIRVAGVNVGRGQWAIWSGELGNAATDFPFTYSPSLIRAELSAVDDFEARVDTRTEELENYSDQISDRLNAEVDDLIATIELNDAGYGATFTEIRDTITTETGELAYQIEGVASATRNNTAAVLQVSTALAESNAAVAEQYQIITASIDTSLGMIRANAELIEYNVAEVSRVGDLTTSNASQVSSLTNRLDNDYYDITAVNNEISIVKSDIVNDADKVYSTITDLNTISTRVTDVEGSVTTLSDAFITTLSDGTKIVSAGYRMRVDANGVIAGMEAIARNDPNSPPISILKFFANSVYYQLGTNLYKMFEGYPVAQQVGGWTSGDSYWKFRNFFSPQLVRVDSNGTIDNSVYGETAGVKVYPVPVGQPIEQPYFPPNYQPTLN